MNALTQGEVIAKLYEASQAGVQVDLIIRGACCLRPGMPGISENIRVRSVVGRFLEHSRIYAFHAAGEIKVFLSSADWMSRNLLRRVETAFPVIEERSKKRILREGLDLPLADDANAWIMDQGGSYSRAPGDGSNDSQKLLLEELSKPGTPQVEIEVKSSRKRGGSGKGSGKGKGKQRAKNKR